MDDWDLDYDLEAAYEDRFERSDDYNVFEENQLALDRDFDSDYDEYDEDEDDEDYAADPWYDDQDEYV